MVFDLSTSCDNHQDILFNHECYQLWESKITNCLLKSSNELITFSQTGINVISFNGDKRILQDNEGQHLKLHSLDSMQYLKLENINYLYFKENRVISIEQEYRFENNEGKMVTRFDEIYKIKINELNIRELLILMSFLYTKTSCEMLSLVRCQPNPSFFYKTCLELDGCNMVTLLSCDTQSMKYLLDPKFSKYFSTQYPIIYKNKFSKRKNNN